MRNFTPEHKNKLSEAHKGKKLSLEHKEKVRLAMLGRQFSPESKKKMSEARKRTGSPWLKGRKQSFEHRKNNGDSKKGEKSHFWKGGISPINEMLRKSFEYRIWRESVFKRDNWTCIWCGQRGGKLHADHIKPFALFPELRFAIDNGRTLCVDCHKTTETYGGKTKSK